MKAKGDEESESCYSPEQLQRLWEKLAAIEVSGLTAEGRTEYVANVRRMLVMVMVNHPAFDRLLDLSSGRTFDTRQEANRAVFAILQEILGQAMDVFDVPKGIQ